MFQTRQKNLVEVCPQCCKSIDSSANRLVHDTCGHSKCRICLLQEITGCLLCVAENKSTGSLKSSSFNTSNSDKSRELEPQPRKSVITSVAIQKAEQKQSEESRVLSPVDKDTCHVIKQSLKKDILFPTEIVKKSTGNFYHLKRVFSQRFFNEDNKKHKACETEENWVTNEENSKTEKEEEITTKKRGWKAPSHIQVQYYCTVHKITIQEKNTVIQHHMSCGSDISKVNGAMFKCNLCEKSYKAVGKLNRHMKFHTKNSRFKCGKCGKSCTDNYALRTHERTHTQQKPYSCHYCDKKFSGLANYKRHEKKHKDEKKFVCDECGFRFITKTELKRHGITHTNIKSFVCSVCSSRFAFKRTLVRHLRIHDLNLTRIQCPHCESTFKRKDNLERHVKTAHFEVKNDKTETSSEKNCIGNVQ